MAVGALEPQFYATFLDKLGLTEEDLPQFDNFEECRSKLTEIFKTKTQAEWCSVFDGSDACVTPVLTFDNVASHKHNRAQNSFAMGKDGLIVPNPAPRLSRTPGVSHATRSPNINPGEHTVEILTEYKYTTKEIKDLVDIGVVEQSKKASKL